MFQDLNCETESGTSQDSLDLLDSIQDNNTKYSHFRAGEGKKYEKGLKEGTVPRVKKVKPPPKEGAYKAAIASHQQEEEDDEEFPGFKRTFSQESGKQRGKSKQASNSGKDTAESRRSTKNDSSVHSRGASSSKLQDNRDGRRVQPEQQTKSTTSSRANNPKPNEATATSTAATAAQYTSAKQARSSAAEIPASRKQPEQGSHYEPLRSTTNASKAFVPKNANSRNTASNIKGVEKEAGAMDRRGPIQPNYPTESRNAGQKGQFGGQTTSQSSGPMRSVETENPSSSRSATSLRAAAAVSAGSKSYDSQHHPTEARGRFEPPSAKPSEGYTQPSKYAEPSRIDQTQSSLYGTNSSKRLFPQTYAQSYSAFSAQPAASSKAPTTSSSATYGGAARYGDSSHDDGKESSHSPKKHLRRRSNSAEKTAPQTSSENPSASSVPHTSSSTAARTSAAPISVAAKKGYVVDTDQSASEVYANNAAEEEVFMPRTLHSSKSASGRPLSKHAPVGQQRMPSAGESPYAADRANDPVADGDIFFQGDPMVQKQRQAATTATVNQPVAQQNRTQMQSTGSSVPKSMNNTGYRQYNAPTTANITAIPGTSEGLSEDVASTSVGNGRSNSAVAEISRLQGMNITLRDRNQSLEERLGSLQHQNATLRANATNISGELKYTKKQLRHHEMLCSDLRSHIFEMEANLSAKFRATLDRNVASPEQERVRVLEGLQQHRQGLDHVISLLDNQIDAFQAESQVTIDALDKMRQKMLVDMSTLSHDISKVKLQDEITIMNDDNQPIDLPKLAKASTVRDEKSAVATLKKENSASSFYSGSSTPDIASMHNLISKLQLEVAQLSQNVTDISQKEEPIAYEPTKSRLGSLKKENNASPLNSGTSSPDVSSMNLLISKLQQELATLSQNVADISQKGATAANEDTEMEMVQEGGAFVPITQSARNATEAPTAYHLKREPSDSFHVEELVTQVTVLEAAVQEKEQDLIKLRAQNEALTEWRDSEVENVADLKLRLEEEKALGEQYKHTIDVLKEEVNTGSRVQDDALKVIASLKELLAKRDGMANEKDAEIEQCKIEIENLRYSLAESEIVEDVLCDLVKTIDNSRETDHEELVHTLEHFAPLERSHYAELDAYEIICQFELANAVHDLEERVDTLTSAQGISEVYTIAMENDLKQTISSLEAKNERKDEMNHMSELFSAHALLNLNDDVEFLERELESAYAHIDELNTSNAQTEQEKDNLKEENRYVNSEIATLMEMSGVLVSERDKLKELLPELKESVNQLTKEKEELTAANEKLNSENEEKGRKLDKKLEALIALNAISAEALRSATPEDFKTVDDALDITAQTDDDRVQEQVKTIREHRQEIKAKAENVSSQDALSPVVSTPATTNEKPTPAPRPPKQQSSGKTAQQLPETEEQQLSETAKQEPPETATNGVEEVPQKKENMVPRENSSGVEPHLPGNDTVLTAGPIAESKVDEEQASEGNGESESEYSYYDTETEELLNKYEDNEKKLTEEINQLKKQTESLKMNLEIATQAFIKYAAKAYKAEAGAGGGVSNTRSPSLVETEEMLKKMKDEIHELNNAEPPPPKKSFVRKMFLMKAKKAKQSATEKEKAKKIKQLEEEMGHVLDKVNDEAGAKEPQEKAPVVSDDELSKQVKIAIEKAAVAEFTRQKSMSDEERATLESAAISSEIIEKTKAIEGGPPSSLKDSLSTFTLGGGNPVANNFILHAISSA